MLFGEGVLRKHFTLRRRFANPARQQCEAGERQRSKRAREEPMSRELSITPTPYPTAGAPRGEQPAAPAEVTVISGRTRQCQTLSR